MLTLPTDWHPVDDPSQKSRFEAELYREIPSGHVLLGQKVKVLARRGRRDDFLFELADGRLARVHLTWAVETNPIWPATWIYASADEWLADEKDEDV